MRAGSTPFGTTVTRASSRPYARTSSPASTSELLVRREVRSALRNRHLAEPAVVEDRAVLLARPVVRPHVDDVEVSLEVPEHSAQPKAPAARRRLDRLVVDHEHARPLALRTR